MSATASRALGALLMPWALLACAQDEGIERRRPQPSTPVETRLPEIDPARVPPPEAWLPRETVPVRDRWRITRSLGLLPYERWDPYNPNFVKGDLPIGGTPWQGWFVNVTAISDTLLEARVLPSSSGAPATEAPGTNMGTHAARQTSFVETAVLSLSLIKGDTVFRPPDYEIRFVPVANWNRVRTEDRGVLNVDPGAGVTRDDHFLGIQELFLDKHLRDVSARYDFDSVRIGIQPFTADFRGFLFIDQAAGVRFFGTRDNNRWQYNAAWLRRLEKDTNSGLNDVSQRLRADDVYVFNLYRQDWPVLGFTTQGAVLHNRNREGDRPPYLNANGFVERPAVLGSGRPHNYQVTYAGVNGDGHFGRWNLSASGYYAFGTDDRGPLSGREEDIGAWFGAAELSRDFDWLRLRASALYASGDRDPFDGKAGGFDAVLENPVLAGADTSYWIRQSIPLLGGGGVALSMRNGVLPSLRTSREHGQSNFTNPGLRLIGFGADADIEPGLRLIGNANYLQFDNVSSLATLRNQRLTSRDIGWDLSLGVQWRPLFIQNIVINASAAVLMAAAGLKQLYGTATESTQYSVLLNAVLTF